MTNIVLIGTGNIGKRHLQSVAPIVSDITCFDVSKDALASVKPFLEANKIAVNPKLAEAFPLESITPKTIVIVATTAQGRGELLEKIMARKPLAIIAEKPLVQNKREYESLLLAKKKNPVQVYVNLSRRAYPTYHALKSELTLPATIHCDFGNLGFGCNGIHFIDLACWLFDAKKYEITESIAGNQFEKRGFPDFYGYLSLTLDKNRCTITLSEGEASNTIHIMTSKKTWTIQEGKKTSIATPEGMSLVDFPILFTSQITGLVVKDILSGKKPTLPTIEECKLAHTILFDFMETVGLEGMNIT